MLSLRAYCDWSKKNQCCHLHKFIVSYQLTGPSIFQIHAASGPFWRGRFKIGQSRSQFTPRDPNLSTCQRGKLSGWRGTRGRLGSVKSRLAFTTANPSNCQSTDNWQSTVRTMAQVNLCGCATFDQSKSRRWFPDRRVFKWPSTTRCCAPATKMADVTAVKAIRAVL